MNVSITSPAPSNVVDVSISTQTNSVTITSPNPANIIEITPPNGGNVVEVYAGIAGPQGPQGPKGDSGESYNQSLNTTDNVTFNSVSGPIQPDTTLPIWTINSDGFKWEDNAGDTSSFGYNVQVEGDINANGRLTSGNGLNINNGVAIIDGAGDATFQQLNVSGATIDTNGNLITNSVTQLSNNFSLNPDGTASFANTNTSIDINGGINAPYASFGSGNIVINYDGSASFSSGKTSILTGDVGGAEFNGSNQAFVGINNTGDVDFGQINFRGVSVNGYLKTETNNAGDKFGLHIHSSGYLSLDGNNFSIDENGSASFSGNVTAPNLVSVGLSVALAIALG